MLILLPINLVIKADALAIVFQDAGSPLLFVYRT